jgi:hypothetical protein
MEPEATDRHFATCGSCQQAWTSCHDFIADPAVRLLGLQGILTLPDANLLVFEHRCGSSVSILAKRLRHLLPGPSPYGLPSLRGTNACPGHCLSLADLAACDQPCINARDRDLIGVIRDIRRDAVSDASMG